MEIARHGTAYTALPAGKLQDLKQFAIHIDLTTSSDGLGSLEKIFGYFISQEVENFFLGQWKDGMELHVRTERNAGGMIFGSDGVLKKDERAACLIIYDGLKMHIYKNGKLIRRDNRGPLSFSNWSREYPLVLGTDATGRSQWRGNLYEVAIYDRAMSPSEVASLSNPNGHKGTRDEGVGTSAAKRQGETGIGLPASGFGKKIEENDTQPLIHYVFRPENTYETEIRGKKALGVRDLGKGGPADLVIPEHFAPYQRVYLGWDPDRMKRSSDWLDVAVNILGFIPFGILMMLSLRKEGTRDEGVGTSAEQRQEEKGVRRPASGFGLKEEKARKQENPPVSSFAKGEGLVVAVVLAVVAGFVVSIAIEYLQAYLPSRDSSLRDLVTNTLGTAMGAVAAALLVRCRQAAAVDELIK